MTIPLRALMVGVAAAVILGACARGAEPAADPSTAATAATVSPSPSSSVPATPAAAEPTPSLSRPSNPADTVKLTQSGGIAGVSNTWTINPDGTWTATDRTERVRSGTLTIQQRSELTALLNNPKLTEELTGNNGPKCADGFYYILNLGSVEYRAASCGEPRPTFGKLLSLIEEATRS